jgi:hypothetical protein
VPARGDEIDIGAAAVGCVERQSAGIVEPQRHIARARHHALLARDFGPADAILPLYVRAPDADRVLT